MIFMIVVSGVVAAAMYVWTSVTLGRVFATFGSDPAKAWIPLVNLVVLFQLAGKSGAQVIVLIIPVYGLVVLYKVLRELTTVFGRPAKLALIGVLVLPIWAGALTGGVTAKAVASRGKAMPRRGVDSLFGSSSQHPVPSSRQPVPVSVPDFPQSPLPSFGQPAPAPQGYQGAPAMPTQQPRHAEPAAQPAVAQPVPAQPFVTPTSPAAQPVAAQAVVAQQVVQPVVAQPVVEPAVVQPVAPAPSVAPAQPVVVEPAAVQPAQPVAAQGDQPHLVAPMLSPLDQAGPVADAQPAQPGSGAPTMGNPAPAPTPPVAQPAPAPAPLVAAPVPERAGGPALLIPPVVQDSRWAGPAEMVGDGAAPVVPLAPVGEAVMTPPTHTPDVAEHTVFINRKAQQQWSLVLEDGRTFAVWGSSVVVGREPTATESGVQMLAIPDDTRTISKMHARFDLANGVWSVTDLGSTNGIVVTGTDGRAFSVRRGGTSVVGNKLKLGSVAMRLVPGSQ
ncbi:MAG: DUF5684 domain-containing protein [Micrococcales bacterium]|nr:DUF5684 domain-containing protein [Micrococcales bacterium]